MNMHVEVNHTEAKAYAMARKGYRCEAIKAVVFGFLSDAEIRQIIHRASVDIAAEKREELRRNANIAQGCNADQTSAIEKYREVAIVNRTGASAIIERVCREIGTPRKEVLSTSRQLPMAVARHRIMYLMACETHLSLPQIGRLMKRDHTTVLHGIRKHCARTGAPLPRGMSPEPEAKP